MDLLTALACALWFASWRSYGVCKTAFFWMKPAGRFSKSTSNAFELLVSIQSMGWHQCCMWNTQCWCWTLCSVSFCRSNSITLIANMDIDKKISLLPNLWGFATESALNQKKVLRWLYQWWNSTDFTGITSGMIVNRWQHKMCECGSNH